MNPSVQKVIEVMKENMHREWSPAHMAEHARLSRRHFSRLFKAETGTTPARFLKSLRMQRAKDLLENSCLATREIIKRVGLGSENHFARDFKKHYGVTPGQVRLAAHLARSQGESVAGLSDDGEAEPPPPDAETRADGER